MSIAEARAILARYPGYEWLLNTNQQYFTVQELADMFHVAPGTILQYIQQGKFPGAFLASQQVGWRIPRDAIILYLANLLK